MCVIILLYCFRFIYNKVFGLRTRNFKIPASSLLYSLLSPNYITRRARNSLFLWEFYCKLIKWQYNKNSTVYKISKNRNITQLNPNYLARLLTVTFVNACLQLWLLFVANKMSLVVKIKVIQLTSSLFGYILCVLVVIKRILTLYVFLMNQRN